ncbi:DUF262 domain-containing protein [Periweissella fabaria]|uniref:GmrSD restriction endonucleases N-terminal domain-containing protein n=1 Tax=Periweissella fabaria TaxID=546157 RepID=A0ABM8Z5B3_9LACO|nr:DUF262 domain-containing protein [Periweissella fabaria]MCM0597491.1 DUF262 domain-containing protein [Periweissella fabaria]CAH0416007.1 hypothetical protein WFA24289_00306 [Periweissella fabaria]
MSDYQVTTVTVSGLKDNIVLPKFQRGYVWNKSKKLELIESLHRGFPFGALLTFQKSVDQKEKLLDGQQRWSTILDFQKNSASYFKKLSPDIYKQNIDKLNSWITGNSVDKISEGEFDDILSYRYDLSDWADEQKEKYNFEHKKAKDIRDLIKHVQNLISEYLKVEDIQIPIIRYTGDEGNIAQVFENLNKGGVQLSKFEIFAAAWTHTAIELNFTDFQNEILSHVKDFYLNKQEKAENYGFSLDGFSEDDLTEKRVINLYELGIGIGRFVSKRVPALVTDAEKSINEIGFGILGISTNIDPKKLGSIPNSLIYIQDNIETILNKADRISNKLSTIFDKLIQQNTNKNNNGLEYHRALSTTYKTLSYFAALWNEKEGSTDEISIIKNIPAYYVKDSIDGIWGNAGDSRLYEFYPKSNTKHYMTAPDKNEFLNRFRSWIRDENTATERFTSDVKALSTIHANLTYLSDLVDYGESLQFEHIYPKARIREKDTGKKVILGRLGNAMYLPKNLNQNKKTKTLYEIDNSKKYDKVIAESFYPKKTDFDIVFEELEDNNFGTVNDKILERSYQVANEIVNKILFNKFE